MSTNETGERGRAEPIDVEFEPADRAYRGGGGGIGMGAALFLALLSAGAGAAGGALAPRIPEIDTLLDKAVPDNQSAAGAATSSEAVAALDTRVKGIETIMNTPFAEAASAGTEGGDIAARTFALQAGLRDISARLDSMPSTTEVTRLVGEVQRLQQELPAVAAESRSASEAARAAFAVAAAAEASRSSGPFQQSYDSLVALLPDDENVRLLAPLARTGAPTRAELREQFDVIDNRIIRAARVQQAGAGFWGRIQAALADYIIVRREGQGDTPDGVVQLAGDRLAADDLAGAIAALSRLSGEARRIADESWLTDAKRRLEIDQRLAAVRTELSRRG